MSTEAVATPPYASQDADGQGQVQKYLSFCLGEEEYALEILAVREIIGLMDITPLPQTPRYVKGVINLRGKIIPVIELRTKFGLDSVPYTEETCIIVVEVMLSEMQEPMQMGLIVDSVREVLDINRGQIEPPPSFGCSVPLTFIMGMGKVKNKVVVLLNITSVVRADELERIASAAGRRTSGIGNPEPACAAKG